jgi:hypothetical protein
MRNDPTGMADPAPSLGLPRVRKVNAQARAGRVARVTERGPYVEAPVVRQSRPLTVPRTPMKLARLRRRKNRLRSNMRSRSRL